jgi:hypothetical protein
MYKDASPCDNVPMLGVVLAVVAASQPSPAPTPLKTITHVRSSSFCTTLRQNIGPTVQALIQNNIAVDETKTMFLKMARDKISSSNVSMVIDMDINGLNPMIGEIAQNLETAQALLNDTHRFPAQPQTADDRQLLQMQKELRTIIDHQSQALNILSGTYFSYNGNRLLGHGDGLKAPIDPVKDNPIVIPPANGTAFQEPAAAPVPAATPRTVDLGLLGFTKFAQIFNNLTTYQWNEESLENRAAALILQSSDECNGNQ